MLDLVLAIVHFLLAFSIAAVLAAELALLTPTMTANALRLAGRVDAWYGILALALIVVGFSRAIFTAKGWAYYSANAFFWAKIGAFALVGLLSIVPTVRLIAWRRAERQRPGTVPDRPAIAGVRRFLWAEAAAFAFIPVFASLMARGYGVAG